MLLIRSEIKGVFGGDLPSPNRQFWRQPKQRLGKSLLVGIGRLTGNQKVAADVVFGRALAARFTEPILRVLRQAVANMRQAEFAIRCACECDKERGDEERLQQPCRGDARG